MKTPKCPLCGTNSEYFLCAIGTNPYYATTAKLFGCPTCKIGFNHHDGWKEYVSKFPPIMRLKPGDLIKIRKLPDNFFVIKTDVEKGVIRAGSTYGYSMSYVPEDVEQWPWELEQKGGSNDI